MKDEKIFETSMVADFRIFGHRNFCWCCKKSIAFRNSENMSCIQIGAPPKKVCPFSKKKIFSSTVSLCVLPKIFRYHTLDSYLCTKSQKFKFFDFLKTQKSTPCIRSKWKGGFFCFVFKERKDFFCEISVAKDDTFLSKKSQRMLLTKKNANKNNNCGSALEVCILSLRQDENFLKSVP